MWKKKDSRVTSKVNQYNEKGQRETASEKGGLRNREESKNGKTRPATTDWGKSGIFDLSPGSSALGVPA